MIYSKVALAETGLVSPLVLDYLNGSKELENFYNQPNSIAGYGRLMQERKFDDDKRKTLVNAFEWQFNNAGLNMNSYPLIASNVALLGSAGTYTITTGHQLCLYGGPLFLTYKILTAVKLCQELKAAYPEKNFVPVLWLASEDHDFEEINNTILFNKEFKWYKDTHHAAVGTLDTDGLKEDIENMAQLIGNNETGAGWINQIKEAYLNSRDLSMASLKLFTELFARFGLLVLEPNQQPLKALLKDIIKADLLEGVSYKAQLKTDQQLAAKYKLQVNARECNFFYLDPTGARLLLKKDGDGFKAGESIAFTRAQIETEADNFPWRFSPNVNLRPLYQETVLPNIAYVGGPAEVAYWLQLKDLFMAHGVQYPAVVLRSMNLLAGKTLTDKVEKLGLAMKNMLANEVQLTQAYLSQTSPVDFKGGFEHILDEFQRLIELSRSLDNQVAKNLLDTKLSLKNFFSENNKHLKKALEHKEAEQIEKLLKLRGKIFPGGVFQERTDTLLQHEVTANRDLKDEILEGINVFEPALAVILL